MTAGLHPDLMGNACNAYQDIVITEQYYPEQWQLALASGEKAHYDTKYNAHWH